MRSTFLAAVAMLALTMPARAAAPQPALSSDTVKVFRSIQNQVLDYEHYTVFDTVSAAISDDGVVTLTGKVTMPYKRDDIERRVSGVKGVRQVHNRIDVLPASKSDDEMRVAIARAIYNNQAFRSYAARVHPPIHVIVERGRVTLEGVVNDHSDRLLALSLAGSHGSFTIVDRLMTVEEARDEIAGL